VKLDKCEGPNQAKTKSLLGKKLKSDQTDTDQANGGRKEDIASITSRLIQYLLSLLKKPKFDFTERVLLIL